MEKRTFCIFGILLMLTAVSESGVIVRKDNSSGDGEIPTAINRVDTDKKLGQHPKIWDSEEGGDDFGMNEFDVDVNDPGEPIDYDYGKPGEDDDADEGDNNKPGIIKPEIIPPEEDQDDIPIKEHADKDDESDLPKDLDKEDDFNKKPGDEGFYEPFDGEEDFDKSDDDDKDSKLPDDEDKDRPNHKDVDDSHSEDDDKKIPEEDGDDDDDGKKEPEENGDDDIEVPEEDGDDDIEVPEEDGDDDIEVPEENDDSKNNHVPEDEKKHSIANDDEQDKDDEKFGGGKKSGFLGGGSIFDTPFFNLNQVQKYFNQLERALGHVFRQTLDEALLLNGTYANTTEEEVDIDGKKYIVQKSVIKGGDNHSSIYVEALSSKTKGNDFEEKKV